MATAIGAPTRSSSGSEKWSHVVRWLQPEGPPGHAGAGCTFYLLGIIYFSDGKSLTVASLKGKIAL